MNSSKATLLGILTLVLVLTVIFYMRSQSKFDIPSGETKLVEEIEITDNTTNLEDSGNKVIEKDMNEKVTKKQQLTSSRKVFITDGVKHSIPLNEIIGGGPPKDGIPSIDNPKFIAPDNVGDNLDEDSIGLGLVINGDARFYPYKILVWHEIVNDTVGGRDVVITYCPLCSTGVVFDRIIDGKLTEFGVSGKLWQSNLLIYNRTGDESTESLWSQVLGEAVLGPATGKKLSVVSTDTVKYGGWKKKYPKTKILSQDTGAIRRYGTDPYGDYYTDNDRIIFPLANTDDRLPNKDFVLGVELNGQFKAYRASDIPEGTSTDTFAGETIILEKSDIGEVKMSVNGEEITRIGGFWFSWVAVHPNTEIYKL